MNEKNVVLLGGSNSVMVNGLQKGLKEGIEKFNTTVNKEQEKLKFYNLALGASSSLQNLYELKRNRNRTILKNAKLIISESNINDSWSYNNFEIYGIIESFFTELSCLNSKILILILPFFNYNSKVVNQIHKKLALKFNFNIIDINNYYEKFNLIDFSFLREKDGSHQFDIIYTQLGNSIINNIENFLTNNTHNHSSTFHFKICEVDALENLSKKNIIYYRSNSAFNEKCIRLFDSNLLKFPNKYKGFKLIGYHCWTTEEDANICVSPNWLERRKITSNILIYNKNGEVLLKPCLDNIFVDIYSSICIDEDTYIKVNKDSLSYCDFIAFFLTYPKKHINDNLNFEKLQNINIKIPKKYNFNHLIPQIEIYKEIINEYHFYKDKSTLSQENLLDFQNNYGKAKARIQNQLSYKLGQALILNSKSVFGFLSLPFIILSIVISHKQEQKAYKFKVKKNPNLALPPLESYPDYNEALKEKECFTYKLGEEFIKASKNWYGGGVYQIYSQRCA
ncbi:hypothetical protein ACGYDA_001072 [Campylobacter jejuni]|nr:alpha-2,3-sialyltransferase [Campylobacter jejuni]EAK6322560.1 alpha-2,3-sialyltransferase [Campylobacter jejuni]EAL6381420.1 alpha-2,3-sialyltransferase [Campylobacter jejuni]EAL9422914.1 alpha-2,3-sialyltransferase [Campylobacter jejuni]EBF5743095.1 alpha-2,3-sialyltransferase [Campylobacter jejuni]